MAPSIATVPVLRIATTNECVSAVSIVVWSGNAI